MNLPEITSLLLLLLLSICVFPVQKISLFIAPLSFLTALLLMTFYGGHLPLEKQYHSVLYIGASFIIISILVRLSSLWIARLISEPLSSNERIIGVFHTSFPKTLLIIIQAFIFLSFLDSKYLWDYVFSYRLFERSAIPQQVLTISLGFLLLILPAVLSGIVISIFIFILSALPSGKRFTPLFSILHSIVLLSAFYYSLPVLVQAINGVTKS